MALPLHAAEKNHQAAEPARELSYTRGIGAEGCPDESALRREIVARLGHDPFSDAPGENFRVEVIVVEGHFVGHVGLVDERGQASGLREFQGSGDCPELVAALALAVSLAIDPDLPFSDEPRPAPHAPEVESLPAGRPRAANASPAARTEPVALGDSPSARPRTEPPRGSGVGLSAGIVGIGAAGIGPSPNLGAAFSLRMSGLGLKPFSVSLEGRWDAPATGTIETGGSFKTSLLSGVLAPCWHVGLMAGCAVALIGRFHAESRDVSEAGSASTVYGALGGRVALEQALFRHVSFQARAEFLGTLFTPTVARNGHDEIWSAPAVSLTLGAGVLAQFP